MLKDIEAHIQQSIGVKQALLNERSTLKLIEQVCVLFNKKLSDGNKVIFAGNGGSAADSQHLAAEFVSRFDFYRPGLAAIALTTDSSMLTAISNDY